MNKVVSYVILLLIFSSCITTKDLTYFQGEPLTTSEIYKLNNQPYRLQVNDVLSIDIKAENEELVALFQTTGGCDLYFNGYTVDRQGNIRIPFIGELNVLGFTEKEVREKIEVELGKYIKNPESTFVTVKLAGIRFLVTGEVGSPGTKTLMQNQVNIIEAIFNAGQINETGNRKKVLIIRNTLDGIQKYHVDFTTIDIFSSENFYVQSNDIIYVEPLKQKALGTGTTFMQTFATFGTLFSFLVSSVLLVKNIK